MISSTFIRRPRLALVISIVISIAGLIALSVIPVAQFPDIVPPQVQVTATYPGASAAAVEESIGQIIEGQVNGVERMIYMKSTSGGDGSYSPERQLRGRRGCRHQHGQCHQPGQPARSPCFPRSATQRRLVQASNHPRYCRSLRSIRRRARRDALFLSNYATISILDTLTSRSRRRRSEPVRQPGIFDADLAGARPNGEPRHYRTGRHQGPAVAERAGGRRPGRLSAAD